MLKTALNMDWKKTKNKQTMLLFHFRSLKMAANNIYIDLKSVMWFFPHASVLWDFFFGRFLKSSKCFAFNYSDLFFLVLLHMATKCLPKYSMILLLYWLYSCVFFLSLISTLPCYLWTWDDIKRESPLRWDLPKSRKHHGIT